MTSTIAIVGRPNVGKSSLFNALLNRNKAITSPNPGLTRDRTYSYYTPAGGGKYLLIDTGGFIFNPGRDIEEKVNLQVEIAVNQADLLLFVVDVYSGVSSTDEKIADKLRKSSKPVILVVNKVDTPDKEVNAFDFYSLGFSELASVSAAHKRNIYSLVDLIKKKLPSSEKGKREEMLKLCIAGKPNVGKSTLVNALAGENRVIVDEMPGTTRNPARCFVKIHQRNWEVVDIAGFWRKKKGKEVEEIISMISARKEIEEANVCIFMLDLLKPISFQDKRIAGWIMESGASVIAVGNKLDLIEAEKDADVEQLYRDDLDIRMPYFRIAPLVLISAITGEGLKNLFYKLDEVLESAYKKVPQKDLDVFFKKLIGKRPPPEAANVRPRVKSLRQAGVNPPVFKLDVVHHRLDKIPKHWKNYVKNAIIKEFGYKGTPVVVKLKRGSKGF